MVIIEQVKAEETGGGNIWGEISPSGTAVGYGEINSGTLSGPIKLANTIISAVAVAAGIWLLITIILQGMVIINKATGPKEFGEAVKKIVFSIGGLVIVVAAYIIAGWLSKFLFGDPNAILQPKI